MNCKCFKCKRTFNEEERIEREVREPYEFWGESGTALFVEYFCPFCGSDDIEELVSEDKENEDAEGALLDSGVRPT